MARFESGQVMASPSLRMRDLATGGLVRSTNARLAPLGDEGTIAGLRRGWVTVNFPSVGTVVLSWHFLDRPEYYYQPSERRRAVPLKVRTKPFFKAFVLEELERGDSFTVLQKRRSCGVDWLGLDPGGWVPAEHCIAVGPSKRIVTPLLKALLLDFGPGSVAALLPKALRVGEVLLEKRTASNVNDLDGIVKLLAGRVAVQYSRAFDMKSASYGNRGGHPYFKPCGWYRVSVDMPLDILRSWPVAYHGSSLAKSFRILAEGFVAPKSKIEQAHGQQHSSSGQSIYVSPSIEYAGHPVYAPLAEAAEGTWLQSILQVRVRPGAFRVVDGTLTGKHWKKGVQFDSNFEDWRGLEWLVESPDDIKVTGIMFRELGLDADATLFGGIAAQVTCGDEGPEYEWTRLRLRELKEAGHVF